MSMRQLLLGNKRGKTGWQRLKDRWAAGKAEDKWEEALADAFNPLGLKPGDLVDLGVSGDESYEVELFCCYRTPDGAPNFARYSLRPLIGDGDALVLEAMPSGELGELIYALFQHDRDVPLDDDAVAMLEAATLVYERETGEVEHHKDFETEAKISVLGKDHELQMFDAFCFNFFDPQNEQSYLAVDALDHPHNTAHVYVGRAIDGAEVEAIGTVMPGGD